jgi:hypothetical protein
MRAKRRGLFLLTEEPRVLRIGMIAQSPVVIRTGRQEPAGLDVTVLAGGPAGWRVSGHDLPRMRSTAQHPRT